MGKEKLTLYMDRETARKAHQVAGSLEKSVSELVREYTLRIHQEIGSVRTSPEVSKWIGVLKSKKSYKQLRDEHVRSVWKRYGNPG